MVRLPRIVAPGHPHHVTQCGNRREQTFFEEGDYLLYKKFLAEAAGKVGAEIFRRLRRSETTGRPLGSDEWLEKLEQRTGKSLRPQKRGPKPKAEYLE